MVPNLVCIPNELHIAVSIGLGLNSLILFCICARYLYAKYQDEKHLRQWRKSIELGCTLCEDHNERSRS